MKVVRKTAAALTVLVVTVALAACGGSSSNGTTDTTDTTGTTGTTGTTISSLGIAADGYLNGATVCLDKNGNKKCDSGEPTTTTGAGGAYTLTGITAADLAAFAIVVEVTTSAVDEERGPITTPYVLTAPAGKTFISPLTTLVHNQMETSGLSIIEAEQTVKTQLGLITMSPFDDYKPGATTASAEAKQLANVAKVITTTIADNKKAIEAAVQASGGTTTVQAVVNIIVQQVMQNLPTIVQNVKSNTDSSGVLSETNVTTISGTVAVTTSDATALQQQLSAAGATVISSDLLTAISNGFYRLDVWNGGTNYGKTAYDPASNIITDDKKNLSNGAWHQQVASNSSDKYYLVSGVWTAAGNDPGMRINPATGLTTGNNGSGDAYVRTTKLDVGNMPISQYLAGSYWPVPTTSALFPAGAVAYRTTFVPTADHFRLETNKTWGSYNNLNSLISGMSIASNNGKLGFDDFSMQFGALDASTNRGELKVFSGTLTYSSTYEKKTVNGVEMILANLIPVNDGFAMFTVYKGIVTGGRASFANVGQIDYSYNFNKIALNAIMAVVGLPSVVQ